MPRQKKMVFYAIQPFTEHAAHGVVSDIGTYRDLLREIEPLSDRCGSKIIPHFAISCTTRQKLADGRLSQHLFCYQVIDKDNSNYFGKEWASSPEQLWDRLKKRGYQVICILDADIPGLMKSSRLWVHVLGFVIILTATVYLSYLFHLI